MSDRVQRLRPGAMLLKFGIGHQGNRCLGTGWGAPERDFVWSEGNCAKVLLPGSPNRGRISLDMWGYVPPGHKLQEVSLFGNGLQLGSIEVGPRTVFQIDFNLNIPGADLNLEFHIPSAKRPSDFEQTTDNRCLGIAVAGITCVRT